MKVDGAATVEAGSCVRVPVRSVTGVELEVVGIEDGVIANVVLALSFVAVRDDMPDKGIED